MIDDRASEFSEEFTNDFDDIFSENKREQIDEHLCEAASRMAEAAGLIHEADEFSWEWHCEMDIAMAEMKAEQSGNPETNSVAAPIASFDNRGVGFGGFFGGDFNGNF